MTLHLQIKASETNIHSSENNTFDNSEYLLSCYYVPGTLLNAFIVNILSNSHRNPKKEVLLLLSL